MKRQVSGIHEHRGKKSGNKFPNSQEHLKAIIILISVQEIRDQEIVL